MPLNPNQTIRRQFLGDAATGENFRDVQGHIDSQHRVTIRVVENIYNEPMTLGNLVAPPDAIELIRIIDLSAQETPVKCGSLVHFVWAPQQGGARVTSIDGLSQTLNGGKRYRFTFRFTYQSQ